LAAFEGTYAVRSQSCSGGELLLRKTCGISQPPQPRSERGLLLRADAQTPILRLDASALRVSMVAVADGGRKDEQSRLFEECSRDVGGAGPLRGAQWGTYRMDTRGRSKRNGQEHVGQQRGRERSSADSRSPATKERIRTTFCGSLQRETKCRAKGAADERNEHKQVDRYRSAWPVPLQGDDLLLQPRPPTRPQHSPRGLVPLRHHRLLRAQAPPPQRPRRHLGDLRHLCLGRSTSQRAAPGGWGCGLWS
jgi:hypothetical protein